MQTNMKPKLFYDSIQNNKQTCRIADIDYEKESMENINSEIKIKNRNMTSELIDETLPVVEEYKKKSEIIRRNTDLTINHLLKIQPYKSRKSFSFKQQVTIF